MLVEIRVWLNVAALMQCGPCTHLNTNLWNVVAIEVVQKIYQEIMVIVVVCASYASVLLFRGVLSLFRAGNKKIQHEMHVAAIKLDMLEK